MADDVEPRTLIVKASLGASEYIQFTQLADAKGLSQSAFVRMLIKEACAKDCVRQTNDAIEPDRAGNGTSQSSGNYGGFTFRER